MGKTLISICIPTYNRAAYLKRCLESVIGYQGDDIEIVIRNNHSPDNTAEVVRKFNDKRIKYYENESKNNMGANFIDVIKDATSKYVYILTDDDYLLPGAIDDLKRFINDHIPIAFYTERIAYLIKKKKIYPLSVFPETRLPHTMSFKESAKVIQYAHVWTSLCFEKDKVDFGFMDKYGRNNICPNIILYGLFAYKIAYMAVPTAVHIDENELYWDIMPSRWDLISKEIFSALSLLKGVCDEQLIIELAKRYYDMFGVEYHELLNLLPRTEREEFMREKRRNNNRKYIIKHYQRFELFFKKIARRLLDRVFYANGDLPNNHGARK
ncbi:MAG: glycosyltransferase family 2 protein [Candidatus Omnitrophica bacterium]|nr:glycosyltransferase family 2 protein [Candidatus Omnitrophota bacterium]